MIIKAVILALLVTRIGTLELGDMCSRVFDCNNGKHCSLSNCTGLHNYDCGLKCSLDSTSCDEYESLERELNYRKRLKLEKAFTVSLMQGVFYTSKRLRRFDKLRRNFKLCSI